ncbi:helix-turn-helix domain-containing protein [Amycolatopsis sp. 195334CR]|uniref:helix-turn-helix domain-containing protein n=1 Tax=Amycolatopsis sp. 195334CR TaxID=2814588 RepID=UPI001A8FEFED|nr:helix-turn-helix domain-containing protein [Amycolatopsis sp. 195334CR]MBN6036648.1 helix-turn-helix transcriptional regulator [Amycolatopsis sp. 195334CR]
MQPAFGRRVREIRNWRKLGLRPCAQLAGISHGYLGKIERGEKAIDSRRVLEGLATALRVAPSDLLGKPYTPTDSESDGIHSALPVISDALTGWRVGEVPDTPGRPWQDVQADLRHLDTVLRPNADYAAQAAMLPGLIRDLLRLVGSDEHRQPALVGLISAYKTAAYLTHDLGQNGLPTLAVERMRQAAEELEDPHYLADVSWRRAQLLSGSNRHRQYELATGIATSTEIPGYMRGMAHLTAALASAVLGNEGAALDHLAEATDLTNVTDAEDKPYRPSDFGRSNVGIWRVTIGVELGYGAKVAEFAEAVHLSEVAPHRQAAFWTDLGRGLLTERKLRNQGMSALLTAEKLAPQKLRTNPFVREAVSTMLNTAPPSADSRDLRGLAWRMGLAPTG